MNNQSLAERLRYHRKIKGFSQEKLSLETNITVRTIQRIENAEVSPHLNTIKLLATSLGIEINDLLPLTDPKEEAVKKKWLLLLHAAPLIGIFVPLCNVLLPLFIWIHKREDNPIYDKEGTKVINFQITALILAVLSIVGLLTIEKWGFVLFIATVPICVVIVIFNIIYIVKKNKSYYPFSIPFLRYKPSSSLSVVASLLSLVVLSHCSAQTSNKITRLDGSELSSAEIDQTVKRLMDTAKVQGLGLAILNDKKTVYLKSYGYKNELKNVRLDTNSIMYAASLSKAVFGYLTMKLVQKKLLDLDRPLYLYLSKPIPEYENFSGLKGDERWKLITARMCLSHTSGLPNVRQFNPIETAPIYDTSAVNKIYVTPGTKYAYSGEGFKLLQLVEEEITKMKLDDLATNEIFSPIGMYKTGYVWHDGFGDDVPIGHGDNGGQNIKSKKTVAVAGGSMVTTIADFSRFVEYVLQGKGLDEKYFNEMIKPQIKISSEAQFPPMTVETTTENDDIHLSYGLGWGLMKTKYGKAFFKEGGDDATKNYNINFVDKGISVIILTNSVHGSEIFKELLETLIGDTFTPWKWEHWYPYDYRKPIN